MRDSKHYGVISLAGEESTVIRKFINPAVYIETTAPQTAKQTEMSTFKIKKCVCATEQENCPCHPEKLPAKVVSVKVSPFSSKSSMKTDSGYSGGSTNLDKDDLRLSLTSLTANSCVNNCVEDMKRKVFQDWLMKKKKEQLLKQLLEEKLEKEREMERLKKLEDERESFRKWLLRKKKEEERKKLEKQRKEEEERIKSARPKHDPEEKEMHLKAWLKRKEKEELGLKRNKIYKHHFSKNYIVLEKKLKEKEDELRAAEEKQKRLEESARAYEEWLKTSKYKPKPLPLSRGIDSNV